jgi:hypothetical protein
MFEENFVLLKIFLSKNSLQANESKNIHLNQNVR